MFKRATKEQLKARIALIGPSGSGKTYSALEIAKGLAGKDGRIAVIDTERGSASKYSGDVAEFDVCELTEFSPGHYVDAIQACDTAGYDVLIIDSLTHAWSGKGGALEMVDNAKKRAKNGFTAWRDVTKEHNRLVDAMLDCQSHVIITMRTKTEYVIEENDRGKKVPRKIGMAPIQRDGLEYEFDIVGEMNQEHDLIITKSRCPSVSDVVVNKPGADFAASISAWLGKGDKSERDLLVEGIRSATTDGEFREFVASNRHLKEDLRAIQHTLKARSEYFEVPWEEIVAIIKEES